MLSVQLSLWIRFLLYGCKRVVFQDSKLQPPHFWSLSKLFLKHTDKNLTYFCFYDSSQTKNKGKQNEKTGGTEKHGWMRQETGQNAGAFINYQKLPKTDLILILPPLPTPNNDRINQNIWNELTDHCIEEKN